MDFEKGMGRMSRRDKEHGQMDRVLNAIEGQAGDSVEQMRQFKKLMEVDKKFRSVERFCTSLYSKCNNLSKEIEEKLAKWKQ